MKLERNSENISSEIELPNGDRLVVVDRLDDPSAHRPEEIHRNLYRIDSSGEVKWQVADYGPFGNSTFTSVFRNSGAIIASNFDGVQYEIVDVDNGKVAPRLLVK